MKMKAVHQGIGRIIGKNSLFYSYAESLRKQNEELKHALRARETEYVAHVQGQNGANGANVKKEANNTAPTCDQVEKKDERCPVHPPMQETDDQKWKEDERKEINAEDNQGIKAGTKASLGPAKEMHAENEAQRLAEDQQLAEWMRELRRAIALENARCSKATELNSSPIRSREKRKALSDTEANNSLGLGQLELGKQGKKVPPRLLLERQWQRVFEEVGVNVNIIDELVDRYLDDSMALGEGDVESDGFDWKAADAVLGDGAPRSVVEARLLAAAARKALVEFKKRDTLLRNAYREAVANAQKFAASQRHR